MPRIPHADSVAQAQHILNTYTALGADWPTDSKRRNETARLTGKSRSQVNTALDIVVGREHLTAKPIKLTGVKIAAGAAAPVPQPPPTPADDLREYEEKKHGSTNERRLKAMVDELIKQKDEAENRAGIALGLEKYKPKITIIKHVPPSGNGIFMGIASDWHIEEEVDPATIQGYNNKYDDRIATERSQRFARSFVIVLEMCRAISVCKEACLAVLGDIINGHIHEEYLVTNLMNPLEACEFAVDLLNSCITYILKHGKLEKLYVPWCVGNHGRLTKKTWIGKRVQTNLEWMIGRRLQSAFKNDPRVIFNLAEGYHLAMTLGRTRVRFHHGDAFKSGGGVGGITIPVNKKIGNWNQGSPHDLDIFGHFHQLKDGGNWICNGSLIGHNPFAVEIGCQFERPKQGFCWLDNKRGKTMSGELFVTDGDGGMFTQKDD